MKWVARLRQAPVTSVLLAINVAVYLVMVVASHHVVSFDRATLILAGASVSAVCAWRTGQRAIARSLLTNVAFIFVVGLFANVDNYAHGGGLLLGALVGLWRARWTRAPSPRTDALLIAASGALSVASLV